jgi:WD40 repeat protein/tRNA A-37 threonylcarbamoyl transferase component Bud32
VEGWGKRIVKGAEPMDAERIFHEAVDITDPEQRAAFLDRVCAGDDQLRSQVEALLRADARAGSFLEAPPAAAGVTLDQAIRIDGPGTVIGRYELLELIGEGGMGLVYLAEQKEPIKRRVALKIIKPGMDSRQVIARFEAERQALALLDHPNVAHVFDAGCTETGRPYFVMEYVKGLSITRYCDEHRLTIEQRLRLFEQVCEAVHHAHQKGIIHRDLKPSNILVCVHDDRAVPKIIDFGIAKAITQPLTDKTFVTFQGQLLGTPEYMSPEQVDLATQDIDTRTDIYSLGVILYELLAGVLPFESDAFERAGLAEIQQTIREMEPASPSLRLTTLGEKAKTIAASRGTQVVPLARRLHRELEWIPLKAMRKDRCRRYRSVSEMADDIRNYLTGLPLLAGPETTVYRVQKFVRKHAGFVTTAALIALAIILGLGASTTMYAKAESARQEEVAAREAADQARLRAEQAEKAARDKAEELRRTLYVNSIQLADAKHRQGDTKAVRTLLESCPNDLRGWEWNHFNYSADQARMVLKGASKQVVHPVFSPDGKLIASGGWDKSIKIWDAATGSERMDLTGHEGAVWCVAFSPDGQRLASASADKTVKIWDVQSGREWRTLGGHDREVCHVTFSPDGKRIASADYGPATKIWDTETGAQVANIQRQPMWVMGMAFSPDGKHIASCNMDAISVWDTASGAEVMTMASAHKLFVSCVAYSPDGKSIVSCGWDSGIKVWDASTGKQTMVLRACNQRLNFVSYDASGKFIVAPDQGNTISVWDTVTGEVVMTLAGHEASIRSVSFSPDGSRIVSGSGDRTIRVWDTSWSRGQMLMRTDSFRSVFSLAYSSDGKRFATGGPKGGVTIWDTAAGTELTTLPAGASLIWDVVFSPDGRWLASGSNDGTAAIWDAATGAKLVTLSEHQAGKGIAAMAFSPDGSNIVVGNEGGDIRVCDTETGKEIMKFPGNQGSVATLAYYPDGRRILSGSWNGTAKVWDAATGTQVLSIKAEQDTRLKGFMAISHDGRLIATSTSTQGNIILWDGETGKQVKTWAAHTTDGVEQLSFSPDDKRLASVGRSDATVKVWDIPAGTELAALVPQLDVYDVAFSPDGRTLTALCMDGVILWETAEPSGGYELRQAGQRARRRTAEAYEKHGHWRDAIEELRADTKLEEPVRKLALQIANSRKWEDARKVVDELYEKRGLYHDVIDKLQEDRGLDESVRKQALEIANHHLWRDADKLWREAYKVVPLPGKDIETYRAALAKAQQANSLDPNNTVILRILGTAQYRAGLYEETLRTFKRLAELRANEGAEVRETVASAFTAMSLHQLGRVDEAKSTLEELRALLKEERHAKSEVAKALLAEAEGLIEGKEP